MQPQLTLVGAGPGDPELISLKGIKALQRADVVLYDALVHPDLLAYAPPHARRIFVGKRAGRHAHTQAEINALIVRHACRRGHVVRLKGGDPFVFGRGHEELRHARAHGISVAVVPGISSSTALAATQHVPVTRRGVSESFWVVTATTRSGALSDDLALAARSTATVVILMGMGKLEEIVACFERCGRGHTPVMIVQNGTLPNEQTVLGTVDTIAAAARRAGVGTPAVITVGEVVRCHPHYARQTATPLPAAAGHDAVLWPALPA